jgi:hypothetical protein
LFLSGRMGFIQVIGAILVITAIVVLQKDSKNNEPILVQE